ncbi:uncharacterized protein L3040_004751 [Drepanopeziza brunnea f. sp. 'multigermtubi']|uniref:uncharacterized protein n=1 Tax=Drepanopeziza brunnea f. sp. 'multigermtubi' TaxID=698441 RepID=UPI00238E0AFA|nr:hypothetical protein L3040_004751 [Drepanopeziza brunnea f. sp. 'multigermtubi']
MTRQMAPKSSIFQTLMMAILAAQNAVSIAISTPVHLPRGFHKTLTCCHETSNCPRSLERPFIYCCLNAPGSTCWDGSPFNTLGECIQSNVDFIC